MVIAKTDLEVAIGSQKGIITFANDQKGVDALVKKLSRIDAQLTVFESTGGYELLAASSLAEAFLNHKNNKELFTGPFSLRKIE